jgi:SPP1 family predicted phage head-tail adaptor
MNAGELDRIITFYVPAEASDASGQVRKSYTQSFKSWAKRQDQKALKDNERVMNKQQNVSYGITQFTIRYGNNIDAKMLISCDGIWFDIVGQPMVDGRKHWTLINAEQRDNQRVDLQ